MKHGRSRRTHSPRERQGACSAPLPSTLAAHRANRSCLNTVGDAPSAFGLLRTQLPAILAATADEPNAILIRAGVPTSASPNLGRLDQWTYVCDWLARKGIPGLVLTLKVIDEIQSTSFCDDISRWTAAFIARILEDPRTGGGGGGGTRRDLYTWLERVASNEAIRWERLRRHVVDQRNEAQLSAEAATYVDQVTRSWQRVAQALVGMRGEHEGAPVSPAAHPAKLGVRDRMDVN